MPLESYQIIEIELEKDTIMTGLNRNFIMRAFSNLF